MLAVRFFSRREMQFRYWSASHLYALSLSLSRSCRRTSRYGDPQCNVYEWPVSVCPPGRCTTESEWHQIHENIIKKANSRYNLSGSNSGTHTTTRSTVCLLLLTVTKITALTFREIPKYCFGDVILFYSSSNILIYILIRLLVAFLLCVVFLVLLFFLID